MHKPCLSLSEKKHMDNHNRVKWLVAMKKLVGLKVIQKDGLSPLIALPPVPLGAH